MEYEKKYQMLAIDIALPLHATAPIMNPTISISSGNLLQFLNDHQMSFYLLIISFFYYSFL